MAGDQPGQTTNEKPDTKKAQDTAQQIEKIDPNKHGQDFLTEVNTIMKAQGLNGNDATSKQVIAQLERDGKLPQVLLEMGDDKVRGSLGTDGNYTKDQLEKIARGEANQYGQTTDAGSKLLANAMLQRFDAISDLDSVDHSKGNKDPKDGKISKGDIQTYGGQRLKDEEDAPYEVDKKRVQFRPGVENLLNAVQDSTDKSPQALQKLKAGQPVSEQEIKDALQTDDITRKVAQAQGLNEEQMAKLNLMSDKDRKAMEFMRDHYGPMIGVKDGAKNIDGDVLGKYARIMGTSNEIAHANQEANKALDTPTTPDTPKPTDDPSKVDPQKAKDAATAIAGIDSSKVQGKDYAAAVDKIMQEKGLTGNDANSKLMIAELERQGKLPQFLANTLGNDDAAKALTGGKTEYTADQLKKLADGQGPNAGSQTDASTRLAAQALLDRKSAVADLDYIDHNKSGDNKARDDHKDLITTGDIRTYNGTQISADDSSHASARELDQKRAQFRQDVNGVLRATSDVKDTDADVLKHIRDGQPVSQQEIKDALKTDEITRKVAQAQGLNEEQMKKLNLLTDDQKKALQYMDGHYDAINGMGDKKGITNKVLDSYATNMGTNRDLATAQGEAFKQLDAKAETEKPADPADPKAELKKRTDSLVDAYRFLDPATGQQFMEKGMTHDDLKKVLEGDKLPVKARETFTDLDKNWDTVVGKDKPLMLQDFGDQAALDRANAVDAEVKSKLAPLNGQKMEGIRDQAGNIDKAKLDELLKPDGAYVKDAQASNPQELAAYQYLQQHFNEMSHDGKTASKQQVSEYLAAHKVADFDVFGEGKPADDPAANQAAIDKTNAALKTAGFGDNPQDTTIKLGDNGPYLYDVARKSLEMQAAAGLIDKPAKGFTGDDYKKEAVRLAIINGLATEADITADGMGIKSSSGINGKMKAKMPFKLFKDEAEYKAKYDKAVQANENYGQTGG